MPSGLAEAGRLPIVIGPDAVPITDRPARQHERRQGFGSLKIKLARVWELHGPSKSSSKKQLMDGKTLGRSTSENTAGRAVSYRRQHQAW